MTYTVRPYRAEDAAAWDAFCGSALQATFLHSRAFLAYHGSRFDDRSLLIEQEGVFVGLFPAALHPADSLCVASHPGSTFGGIVHQGQLRGESMLAALDAVCAHYAAQGMARLLYKAVPVFYHRAPAQDDLYALHRAGAQRVRCDLSSTIDLQHRLPVGSRRQRSLKKAIRSGLMLSEDPCHLEAFWSLLSDNLARKHGVAPVHSLAEMAWLAVTFSTDVRLLFALRGDEVVAGTVLFTAATAWHTQYIAASPAGHHTSALDLVFEHAIEAAAQGGKRWFDFGISTEDGGARLNASLYQFKSEFGAGGTVHDFFELSL